MGAWIITVDMDERTERFVAWADTETAAIARVEDGFDGPHLVVGVTPADPETLGTINPAAMGGPPVWLR